MNRARTVAAGVSWCVLSLPAGLQAQPEPPCTDTIHSSFDFWIGSWEVRLEDGSLAGHNTIRRTAGGCALTEEWRGVSGSRGESINYVSPVDGRWNQLWVDNSGLVLRLAGGPDGPAMVMEGVGRDTTRLQRITWTPLEDGRVRQLWEVSREEGTGWSTLFDGYYVRLPASETADVGSDRCATPQGQRFDFWPGEWRVESRLRTELNEWRTTHGVWTAEAVLDGCGFLDFTTADYGQGTMSGVGSRFYDPERDLWVVTWASTTDPGKLGVWEGRFGSDGTGEFHRDTETPEGRVRSRIRWMNIRDDAADWEFSVSRDGGHEWQVLWQMKFERLVATAR